MSEKIKVTIEIPASLPHLIQETIGFESLGDGLSTFALVGIASTIEKLVEISKNDPRAIAEICALIPLMGAMEFVKEEQIKEALRVFVKSQERKRNIHKEHMTDFAAKLRKKQQEAEEVIKNMGKKVEEKEWPRMTSDYSRIKFKMGDILINESYPGVERRIIGVRGTGYVWDYPALNDDTKYFHSEDSTDPYFEVGWQVKKDPANS